MRNEYRHGKSMWNSVLSPSNPFQHLPLHPVHAYSTTPIHTPIHPPTFTCTSLMRVSAASTSAASAASSSTDLPLSGSEGDGSDSDGGRRPACFPAVGACGGAPAGDGPRAARQQEGRKDRTGAASGRSREATHPPTQQHFPRTSSTTQSSAVTTARVRTRLPETSTTTATRQIGAPGVGISGGSSGRAVGALAPS